MKHLLTDAQVKLPDLTEHNLIQHNLALRKKKSKLGIVIKRLQ